MPQPGEVSQPQPTAEDSFLDLLVETLEGLEETDAAKPPPGNQAGVTIVIVSREQAQPPRAPLLDITPQRPPD